MHDGASGVEAGVEGGAEGVAAADHDPEVTIVEIANPMPMPMPTPMPMPMPRVPQQPRCSRVSTRSSSPCR